MTDRRGAVLYARCHHGLSYAVGSLVAAVLLRWSLGSTAQVEGLVADTATPLHTAVGMLLGVLAGVTWTASAQLYDRGLTRGPATLRRLHPWLVIACSGACGLIATIGTDSAALGMFRSVVCWASLSLISAALFSGTFAWVLPVGYFLLVANLSAAPAPWWDLPGQPTDSALGWALTAAVALITAVVVPRSRRH